MDRQPLQERLGLYSLLRALYTYPLAQALLESLASLPVAPDSALSAPLRQMQSFLSANGLSPASVAAVNVEMTRLLEGPGLTPAPPYASYYLHGGQLMGPEAAAVRRFYLAWQALPDGQARLPDDHLALELGFLAYLAGRAVDAITDAERDAALEASRDFINRHLLSWLPRFGAAVTAAGTTPFFRGLAHLTEVAVLADAGWLAGVLDREAPERADARSAW